MKGSVSCSLPNALIAVVVMRVEPKSASKANGGVESEMRMLGWGGDHWAIGPSDGTRVLTPLMFPCATPQLWRYLIPLITPNSYGASRFEVSWCLGLAGYSSLPDVGDLRRCASPDTR